MTPEEEIKMQQLRAALLLVMDQVDYIAGNCHLVDMVGAVLDRKVIAIARAALEVTK